MNDVPEEALDVKSLRRSRSRFVGCLPALGLEYGRANRHRGQKVQVLDRGGQGRAGQARPEGEALTVPVISSSAHDGLEAP